MPSSNLIDEGVVRMRMDDEQFHKGAERTMGTLEKLKKSLNFKDAKIGDVDTSAFENSLAKLVSKVEIFKKRVIENLADTAVDVAKNIVTGADYITPGFQKYEDQVAAIQKLMIATGASMDDVQKISDKILKFTDETSYEFTSMMNTMSSFTSSGMGMEDAANTILGMAVAAGQAGVNAKDATHAFMGFQKAISSGYMSSANWDWIRTAGMNSAELKQQLLDAAVATGDLQKGADGVYYAIKETKKEAKQIEVSVENFEQSFSDKWLSGEAIKQTMSKYSTAFNQIMAIHEKTGAEIFEIISDDSPYLQYIDAYGLAAFKAGQETKTWSDAVEALRSAMSSGWMKSFELIIGNYKEASGFFSKLIEPLYEIFVNPGNKRNAFLEYAFGKKGVESSGITKTTANWNKLQKKLKETGHTVSELEEAFKKVVSASEDERVQALAKDYRDLEEAIKQGAVSGDLLNDVLNNVAGVTTDTAAAMAEGAVDATAALEKYKQVAMEVLHGDYGNGQDRRDAIEAMGLDYDTVQWLVGNLNNGKGFDAITLEWFQSTAPNAYQRFIDVIGNGSMVIDAATGQIIALGDVVDEFSETIDPLTDKINKMTGRELWQGGVLNIINALAAVLNELGEAFNEVFGDAEHRGKGFRNILEQFYRLTLKLTPSEKSLESIRKSFVGIFQVLKLIPNLVGKVFSAHNKLAKIVFKIIDKVLSLFTGGNNVEKGFGTISSILSKIGSIAEWVWDKLEFLLDAGLEGFSIILDWLNGFSFKDWLKPLGDFFKGESGIGKFFTDLISPFTSLFGEKGEGGIFARIKEVFSNFTNAAGDVSTSVDNMDESVKGVIGHLSGLSEVTRDIGDALNGDETTWRDRISKMWDVFKKVVAEEYHKINWSSVLETGKAGLLGYLVIKLGELFKNTNRLLRVPTSGLSSLVNGIIYPFQVLGETISKHEKADRYLKIAAAIGVLSLSLLMLAQIPEDTFSTVVMGMSLLLWIMMKMAKATDSFSLFSGNSKNVSKNNPVTNTVKAFENLHEAFKLTFQGNKFNLNVFSNMAQVLIALGVTLAIIVGTINKIHNTVKTMDDLKDLVPSLILIGGIMSVLMLVAGVMAAVSKDAKNAGKLGKTIIALTLSVGLIIQGIVKIGKLSRDDLDWTAMLVMLGMIVVIMGMIGFVMKSASGMVKQGQSMITSGSAVWAIAGVMLSIAFLVKSLIKSMENVSKMQGLKKGLGIVAGLLLGIIVIITIMSAIVSNDKTEPGAMMKLAGSMIILALALGMLVPALLLLARLPSDGLLAAAAALGIVALAMSVAMSTLATVNPTKLLAVGAVVALIVIAFGALAAGSALLVTAMIGVAQVVPWDLLTSKMSEFFAVIKSEWFVITMLVVAVVALGIGFLGCGISAAGFGIGVLAIAGAIYVVALAIPVLVDSVLYLMSQIQEHGWELVAFVALVLTAILAVMVARRMDVVKVMAMYADAIIAFIQAPATISKILKVLAIVLFSCFAFLQDMMGPLLDRVIQLLVAFFNGLADAVRSNKGNISGAIYNLVTALLELIWQIVKDGFNLGKKGLDKASDWLRGILYDDDDPRRLKGQGFFIKAKALDAENVDIPVDKQSIEKTAEDAAESAVQTISDAFNTSASSQMSSDTFYNDEVEAAVEKAAKSAGNQAAKTGKKSFVSGFTSTLGASVMDVTGDDLSFDILSGTGDMFSETGTGFGSDLGDMASKMITNSLNGSEVQKTATDGGTNIAGNWIGGISTSLTETINTENILGGIKTLLSNTLNSDTTQKDFYDSGTVEGESNVNGIVDYVTGSEAANNLTTSAETANDTFAGGWDARSDQNVFSMAANTVLSLVNRIREAVDAHMPSAGEYAFNSFQNAYEQTGEINSPSRAMEREGEYTADGLIKGIKDKLGEASAAGNELGNAVFDGHSQALATGLIGSQASSEMERWKILQDTQEQMYWHQQDLNQMSLRQNPMATRWDDFMSDAADSDSWVDALEGSLNDEMNQESVNTAIGNMIGMTFDGETATMQFTESGNSDGTIWTTGLSDGIKSEESAAMLVEAGQVINDAASVGWTTESDINTPLMTSYMVSGLTTSFETDPEMQASLENLGRKIYKSVERGMRKAAGIASPSKEMAKNGLYLMLGLANGIEQGSVDAISAGTSTAGTVMDGFRNAITQTLAAINGDMTMQPVITPVVDMSDVNSAISGIQNGFGNGYDISAELTNTVGRRTQPRLQQPVPTNPADTSGEYGNGIVVNVYPANGMDERALADKVYYKIREMEQRTRVAKG